MQNKRIQLFILPFAGGSASSFRRISELIIDEVDTIAVEYSGHGSRAKQPLASNIHEMMEDTTSFILERRDGNLPYAVFGYSMGTLLGYELLVNQRIPGCLLHFFIGAEVAPQTRALELRQEKDITDEKVLNRAAELGGLDERMLNNKRFCDIYIKPMIADYKHFFEYRYVDYKRKLKCNASFFYCEYDTHLRDVVGWEQLIEGRFDYHEMGNNHFFINDQYKKMADIINKNLEYYLMGDQL